MVTASTMPLQAVLAHVSCASTTTFVVGVPVGVTRMLEIEVAGIVTEYQRVLPAAVLQPPPEGPVAPAKS